MSDVKSKNQILIEAVIIRLRHLLEESTQWDVMEVKTGRTTSIMFSILEPKTPATTDQVVRET